MSLSETHAGASRADPLKFLQDTIEELVAGLDLPNGLSLQSILGGIDLSGATDISGAINSALSLVYARIRELTGETGTDLIAEIEGRANRRGNSGGTEGVEALREILETRSSLTRLLSDPSSTLNFSALERPEMRQAWRDEITFLLHGVIDNPYEEGTREHQIYENTYREFGRIQQDREAGIIDDREATLRTRALEESDPIAGQALDDIYQRNPNVYGAITQTAPDVNVTADAATEPGTGQRTAISYSTSVNDNFAFVATRNINGSFQTAAIGGALPQEELATPIPNSIEPPTIGVMQI